MWKINNTPILYIDLVKKESNVALKLIHDSGIIYQTMCVFETDLDFDATPYIIYKKERFYGLENVKKIINKLVKNVEK